MKRILFLIMLLNAIFTLNVYAQDNSAVFKVADVYEKTAASVRVPVYTQKNVDFSSFEIVISYDNTVIKPRAVNKNALLAGQLVSNLKYTENSIKLVYASSEDVCDTGTMFYVVFDVLTSDNFKTDIKADIKFLSNSGFEAVPVRCLNGSIEINNNYNYLVNNITEISDNMGTCKVVSTWENNSIKYLEDTILYIAAYDKNAKLVDIDQSMYSFMPNEKIQIVLLLNDDDIYSVKLMAWSEDMKPYSDIGRAVINDVFDVAIISMDAVGEEDTLKYNISVKNSQKAKACVYAAAYDYSGKMVDCNAYSLNNSDDISSVEGTFVRSGIAKIKCFVLDAKTLTPLSEYRMFNVR